MSFFNEFLLGETTHVLEHVNHGSQNNQSVQIFEFKGITDLDMGILFSIVKQEEFKFSRHELLPLEEHCPVETLFPLPDDFVKSLAELSDEAIILVAQEWAATEELNCAVEPILEIVQNLCVLARQKEAHLGLFFRITV